MSCFPYYYEKYGGPYLPYPVEHYMKGVMCVDVFHNDTFGRQPLLLSALLILFINSSFTGEALTSSIINHTEANILQ